jgi:hypothetical protein
MKVVENNLTRHPLSDMHIFTIRFQINLISYLDFLFNRFHLSLQIYVVEWFFKSADFFRTFP